MCIGDVFGAWNVAHVRVRECVGAISDSFPTPPRQYNFFHGYVHLPKTVHVKAFVRSIWTHDGQRWHAYRSLVDNCAKPRRVVNFYGLF